MKATAPFAWDAKADRELASCLAGSMSNATIAARLGTTVEDVVERADILGLRRPKITTERGRVKVRRPLL